MTDRSHLNNRHRRRRALHRFVENQSKTPLSVEQWIQEAQPPADGLPALEVDLSPSVPDPTQYTPLQPTNGNTLPSRSYRLSTFPAKPLPLLPPETVPRKRKARGDIKEQMAPRKSARVHKSKVGGQVTQAQRGELSNKEEEEKDTTNEAVRGADPPAALVPPPVLLPSAPVAVVRHDNGRPPSPSKRARSRPSSPTKSSLTKSSNVAKKERLALLTTPVRFRGLPSLKKLGAHDPVRQLWGRYIKSVEFAVIPDRLKEPIKRTLDTPTKTRPEIPSSAFGFKTRYQQGEMAHIWSTISDILEQAERYRLVGCPEAHWTSVVVSPLLHLVRRLQRYTKDAEQLIHVLDITTVEISPPCLLSNFDQDLYRQLDKRIDYAIGLNLDDKEIETLSNGHYRCPDAVPSINQTQTFINYTPIFLNVEVKMPTNDKDPLIQLAAWISAEFAKRKIEDYSIEMPTLAVEVIGDNWNLYLVHVTPNPDDPDGFCCQFVGPELMGSTITTEGCFKILHVLCSCVDWGLKEYRQWFENEVLAKYY